MLIKTQSYPWASMHMTINEQGDSDLLNLAPLLARMQWPISPHNTSGRARSSNSSWSLANWCCFLGPTVNRSIPYPPCTEKACSPRLCFLTLGTTTFICPAERNALLGAYRVNFFRRYPGPPPWTILCIKQPILNRTRPRTGNQCKVFKIGAIWSLLPAPVSNLAVN